MGTEKICHVTNRAKFWITKNLDDVHYDVVYTDRRICLFPSEPPKFWRDIDFGQLGLIGGGVGAVAGMAIDFATRGLGSLFQKDKSYRPTDLDAIISKTKSVSIPHKSICLVEAFRQPKGFFKKLFLDRPDYTIKFFTNEGVEFYYQLGEMSREDMTKYLKERALDSLPIKFTEYDPAEAKRIMDEYFSKEK